MKDELTVGNLRQQCCFISSGARVVLIPDAELLELLGPIRITLTRCYPDTVDEEGKLESTFKIAASLYKPEVK